MVQDFHSYLYKSSRINNPPEECPICMLPLPLDVYQVVYKSCFGKDIYAMVVFML